MLRERVSRPGLEVGAELTGVAGGGCAGGVAVLSEVSDGDERAKEEEGLGGFEVGCVGTDRERGPPEFGGCRDVGLAAEEG